MSSSSITVNPNLSSITVKKTAGYSPPAPEKLLPPAKEVSKQELHNAAGVIEHVQNQSSLLVDLSYINQQLENTDLISDDEYGEVEDEEDECYEE